MNTKMKTQMWTYMFVMFLTLQRQCSACEWLGRYRMISNESLSLLKEMGGKYPEDTKVSFPGRLYNMIDNAKVEDQVKFLVLTLDHIIRLMDAREHMNSVQWNLQTVEHFLTVLNRQSSDLKECVARYHKPSHKESYEIKINRHFKILKKNLKKKEYSAQAWEQIRRAVKHHLQRMDIIASIANRR
uniref:Interferon a n=2 Tax=Mylopharyngodon piceus TaxID=75356 RepID=A0A0G3XQU7_MYLPI|nr:interferon a [Mylopharyngodon piceus]